MSAVKWKEIKTLIKPHERESFGMCNHGNRVYIFGGYCDKKYFNDLWFLDINMKCIDKLNWINVDNNDSDKPVARAYHSLNYYDGKLYIIGGYGPYGGKYLSDLWEYDIQKNKYSQISLDSKILPSISRHKTVIYNERMLIFGGISKDKGTGVWSYYNDMYSFDLKNYKLVKVNCIIKPPKRYQHGMKIVNGILYICGGLNENDDPLNDIWCVQLKQDPNNMKWIKLSILNINIYGHSMISNDGIMIMMGGKRNKYTWNNSILIFDDVHKMDKYKKIIVKDEYIKRFCHDSCTFKVDNNEIFVLVFGGYNGLKYLNDCYMVTIKCSNNDTETKENHDNPLKPKISELEKQIILLNEQIKIKNIEILELKNKIIQLQKNLQSQDSEQKEHQHNNTIFDHFYNKHFKAFKGINGAYYNNLKTNDCNYMEIFIDLTENALTNDIKVKSFHVKKFTRMIYDLQQFRNFLANYHQKHYIELFYKNGIYTLDEFYLRFKSINDLKKILKDNKDSIIIYKNTPKFKHNNNDTLYIDEGNTESSVVTPLFHQ